MRRISELLPPLSRKDGPAPPHTPSASGFLTIGTSTYIDPHGTYPLDHHVTGAPVLIVNDTDQPITVVTERNRYHPPAAPSPHSTDLVLAPGERTETRRGDSVYVG